jgi:hypothetical protein
MKIHQELIAMYATPHRALQTQQWLQQYGWEVLQHPTNRALRLSPLKSLKQHLLGQQFVNDDTGNINVVVTTW